MAEIHEMVSDCEKRMERLNDYDKTFLTDIAKQMAWGRRLSTKQKAYLEEVWDKATEDG